MDLRRPGNELEDDHLAYAEAWQTICHEPGTFLYACVVRVGRFWSPLPHRVTAAETPWAVRRPIELDLRARFGQLPLPHRVTAEEPPLRRLSRYAVALWYLPEFLLAILGLWWLWKCPTNLQISKSPNLQIPKSPNPEIPRPPSSAWHWGLLLIACLMAGHLLDWTDMRMRAPIMPVVAIFAAAGLPCCRPRPLK